MSEVTYAWCFVVMALMAILFFPLFIFFALTAGIIMIAALLI